jgi:hypothetical protein
MAHAFAGLQYTVQQDDGWVLAIRWTSPVTVRQTDPVDLLEVGAWLTH